MKLDARGVILLPAEAVLLANQDHCDKDFFLANLLPLPKHEGPGWRLRGGVDTLEQAGLVEEARALASGASAAR